MAPPPVKRTVPAPGRRGASHSERKLFRALQLLAEKVAEVEAIEEIGGVQDLRHLPVAFKAAQAEREREGLAELPAGHPEGRKGELSVVAKAFKHHRGLVGGAFADEGPNGAGEPQEERIHPGRTGGGGACSW